MTPSPLTLTLSLYNYIGPFMLLNSTAVGFTIGYFMHQYEETAEERTQLLLTKYAHAPKEWVEVKRDGTFCNKYSGTPSVQTL